LMSEATENWPQMDTIEENPCLKKERKRKLFKVGKSETASLEMRNWKM
jgi:hypothetical protein